MSDQRRDRGRRFGPVPHGDPGPGPLMPGRSAKLLIMLAEVGRQARVVVSAGRDAYVADTDEGLVLRLAGQALVVRVATIAERMPDDFKDAHPDIPWDAVRGMRNVAAHQYERSDDDVVYQTLVGDIPDLLVRLGIDGR